MNLDINKLMNCNAVQNCLKEHELYLDKDEVIRTEIFINNRYENGSLMDWQDANFEKENYLKPDIIDYYLRTIQDLDVIKITNIDELVEYLLKRYYSCNSKNDYDYTFLFDSLNKEIFINKLIENKVAKNLYYVDGNYYLYKDDYTLNHRMDLYHNYFDNDILVPLF